jgi:hypothetical protein
MIAFAAVNGRASLPLQDVLGMGQSRISVISLAKTGWRGVDRRAGNIYYGSEKGGRVRGRLR